MLARTPMFLAVAALVSGTSALAMSFGRAPSTVLLGSPLNFAVPVRIDAGESVTPECVAADVQVGDRRLLPGEARINIEPGAGPDDRILRVTTNAAMDEPVIAVTVTVGCGARSSRRFTAFADPPDLPIAPPVVAALPASPGAASAAAQGAGSSAATSSPVSSAGVPQVRDLAPQRRAAAERRPRTSAPRPPRVAREAAQRPVRVAPAPVQTAAPAQAAAVPPARSVADAERSRPMPLGSARLRLESADPADFPPPSADAAARAAQAPLRPIFSDSPLAVELAASEAARMLALETSVETLRAESAANREAMQRMRAQLSESEFNSRLVPWLGAGLALLAALALWLGLRLRKVQNQAQGQWWASASAPLADEPAQASAAAPAAAAAAATLPAGARAAVTASEPATAPSRPKPAAKPAPETSDIPKVVARLTETDSALGGGATVQMVDAEGSIPGRNPRDVAIDELIDLEQQADFFVVLGQDDAAIDLLLGHIRSSGGQSPMPYMKLLEIYRRKDDREAYDRLRDKFNLRFNAVAPPWEADLRAGRAIEEYPAEFARLSAVWSRPIDALAELEALLFRRESGESGQAFELPAYRDLLFLYSLARDHLQDATGSQSAVDLLLPLGDASADPADGPGATLSGPDWDNARKVEITSSSEFSSLDLDLATMPAGIEPARVAEDAPAGRLLDVDLELRLDDPAPTPGDPAPSRR